MTAVTHSDLAKMLDGHEADDFTKHVFKTARDNRLVMLYPIGDDVLKFSGFFNNEADCFRGGDVHLVIENGELEVYRKAKESTKKIIAFWEEHRAYTWKFLTTIPHSKFTIRKNGKKWCEAIIFKVDDIRP
jgi:hypothetical protein